MPRDEEIKIRLTAEERAMFIKASSAAGLSISAWLRSVARAAIAKAEREA